MSRDLRFFFFGFVSCILVFIIGFKIVLIREEMQIRKYVNETSISKDRVQLSSSDEIQAAVLQEGTLPSDIYSSQVIRTKTYFDGFTEPQRILFLGRTYRSYEPEKFLGILRLDETGIWKKYIEVPFPYSIIDVWPEQVLGEKETRMHIQVKNNDVGAGSGEGFLIELQQEGSGWKTIRCMYHAFDNGIQKEFIQDIRGIWFEEQFNKGTGKTEKIEHEICAHPPQITFIK